MVHPSLDSLIEAQKLDLQSRLNSPKLSLFIAREMSSVKEISLGGYL